MNTELTRREQTRLEAVQQEHWLKPACDVFENDNEWLIKADIPGSGQQALKLRLDNNELTIEAQRDEHLAEESFAGYRRVFALPSGIDGDKVKAELNHGVVSVHLPKSDAVRPRRIEVAAG